MFEGVRDLFRGARRIEVFLLAVLAALVGFCLLNTGTGNDFVPGNDTEARLEAMLSCIGGVDNPHVMINDAQDGSIKGVVVIAGGMSEIKPRLNVQNAVSTILDVDLSRIEIIDRE